MNLRHLAGTVCLGLFASSSLAQGLPQGTVVSNAALSALFTFKTDLDTGGDFSWGSARAAGGMLKQFTPQFSAGFSVSYE